MTYDAAYALRCLLDAIEFAEIEQDFQPLRRWAREIEFIIAEQEVDAQQIPDDEKVIDVT